MPVAVKKPSGILGENNTRMLREIAARNRRRNLSKSKPQISQRNQHIVRSRGSVHLMSGDIAYESTLDRFLSFFGVKK
jgi:hypothetical protein